MAQDTHSESKKGDALKFLASILESKTEAKKTLGVRVVLPFGAPSACLEPSWLQVGIFIDFQSVLASLGSLLGLSWKGFGPILAPSGAYPDPPCGCFLLSPGCLCFPTLPFQDLP